MESLLLVTALGAMTVQGADDARFGGKDPGLVNLKGSLYFLSEGTTALPSDFSLLPVRGVLFGDRLDVPDRSFTLGFPGVAERHEWFALVFEGQFTLETAGRYDWRLVSDDGSKLWVDDAVVVDNDGQHPPLSKAGSVELQPGTHRIRVAYFQGPATQVALQLFVTPPGQKERIFVITDFSRQLTATLQRLGAQAGADGIKVKLDASKLFAPGKSELNADAQATLDDLAQALKSAPGAAVKLRGLTRAGTGDDAKPGLAEARAAAVKRALAERDTAGARLTDKGWGGDAAAPQVELLIAP